MRASQGPGLAERLRRVVLGEYAETTLRLKRDVEELRRALQDSAALQARVVAALHEEAHAAPEKLTAALMPLVDELLHQHTAGRSPRSPRRYWPWLSAIPAAGAAALALMSWQGPAAVVSAATEQAPRSVLEHAAVPLTPILEEQAGAFGLGQGGVRDQELAREVRARLSACEPLRGRRVLFSVKDGWVWLRGQVTASGRDAADRALADLDEGVVLVNQLTVPDSTAPADP